MEYNTTDTVFAPDNFSWANRSSATPEPPTLVGDIADANSHITINSVDFQKEKDLLVIIHNLNA